MNTAVGVWVAGPVKSRLGTSSYSQAGNAWLGAVGHRIAGRSVARQAGHRLGGAPQGIARRALAGAV